MQGKKNYQEKLFTTFQLSSRVPEDNLYRRMKEVLDLQWLYKATSKYYGTEGQKSIDPVVFFKMILIGYLENLSSDRKIITTVSLRLDMLYFIGYDIDEDLPWHSTISRTRQLYSEDVFKELFRQVLKQCIDKEMIAGHCQVIDSVFVKANASMDSLIKKEILDNGATYAGNLYEQDKEEKNSKGKTSNRQFYSPTDPDAKIATKPGKPTQLNYLAQVSVDSESYVITNIDAFHADKRDSECLEQVVDNTIKNLKQHGILVEEIIADTNYSSSTALKYLDDNGISGYIPNTGTYKADREGFTYDKVNDQYICSQGVRLPFRKMEMSRGRRYRRTYSSFRRDCGKCPIQSSCIGTNGVKKITVTEDKPLFEKMHARLQTSRGKWMMKLRKKTVEPVLGTLVNFLGMRKVNTKGIEQTNKCVTMAALAYNLKKLLKFKAPKIQVAIRGIEKELKNVRRTLFHCFQVLIRCNRSYTPMSLKTPE